LSAGLLENIGDLAAHLRLIVEAPFAIFHFPAQVGASVEPEALGVLTLVA
jgi:hypothetical protein